MNAFTAMRIVEIQQAINWIKSAQTLAREVDGWRSHILITELDLALTRIHSALDIKPQAAAVEAIVAAQKAQEAA